MLIMSVRPGERVVLYDPDGKVLGTITVTDIQYAGRAGFRVSIGLDFPREVQIVRDDAGVKKPGSEVKRRRRRKRK